MKTQVFIDVDDGSCRQPLQVVVARSAAPSELHHGAVVRCRGQLQESPAGVCQRVEFAASSVDVIGACDPNDYPFKATNRYTPDQVRQYWHFRSRSRRHRSMLRIRHALTRAMHDFFSDSGYCHVDTPILTSNNCEGGSDAFNVNRMDRQTHYFGAHPVYLTVSGQLHLEATAL